MPEPPPSSVSMRATDGDTASTAAVTAREYESRSRSSSGLESTLRSYEAAAGPQSPEWVGLFAEPEQSFDLAEERLPGQPMPGSVRHRQHRRNPIARLERAASAREDDVRVRVF